MGNGPYGRINSELGQIRRCRRERCEAANCTSEAGLVDGDVVGDVALGQVMLEVVWICEVVYGFGEIVGGEETVSERDGEGK